MSFAKEEETATTATAASVDEVHVEEKFDSKYVEKAKEVFHKEFKGGEVTLEKFTKWYCKDYKEQLEKGRREVESENFAKRMRMTAPAAPASAAKAVAAAPKMTPAKEKKMIESRKQVVLKGLVTSLKTGIKSKKFYAYGSSEVVPAEVAASPEDFQLIFGSVGTVPSDAKPSKVVTVKNLSGEDIESVFGTMLNNLSTQTYSSPRNFQKQYKTGSAKLTVCSASLHYSTNTATLKVKFSCECDGADGADDERGSYYFLM
jgi:hypothetical protein